MERESDFQERLANILYKDYGHEVRQQVRYTSEGGRGRLDLYVRTSPSWEHHKTFPVIGIELKRSDSLGPIIDAISQVDRYCKSRLTGDYGQLERPSIILLCTPDLWNEGVLYRWRHPKWEECMSCERSKIFDPMTDVFERVLWKSGGSLLKYNFWRRGFLCNHSGPAKWYEL